MTWFLESPYGILLLGVCVAAGLGIVFYNTRNSKLLWAIGGVLGLTALGLICERLVVTEYEEVEMSLSSAARALRSGDTTAVLSHIGSPQIRDRVKQSMSQYDFYEAGYGSLQVRFNRVMNPPTATAEFMGRVSVNFKGGGNAGTVVQRMRVRLEKQGDKWLVIDYEFRNIQEPIGP